MIAVDATASGESTGSSAAVRLPRELYPPTEPQETGSCIVGGLPGPQFDLYYEVLGPREGIPVVFLHGGPGAGCSRRMAQLFDTSAYRVVLFDQRGCGKSSLHVGPDVVMRDADVVKAILEGNTTWELVKDMESLREHLGIDKWMVCGGSWGTTLALAYASKHSDRVLHMILRGVCLFRDSEFDHIYGSSLRSFNGLSARGLLPDGAWEAWTRWIPTSTSGGGAAIASGFLDVLLATAESTDGKIKPNGEGFVASDASVPGKISQPGVQALLASWFQWEMMLMFARRPKGLPAPAESSSEVAEKKVHNFPEHSDEQEVHSGVACDGCGKRPILGACFKCNTCQNYDLCEACYQSRQEAHPEHEFTRRSPPPAGVKAMLGSNMGTVRQALLEMHYVHHQGFLLEDVTLGQVPMELLEVAKGFPFTGVLVHGAGDAVCPVENAEDLASSWSGAELCVTEGGHSQWDAPNIDAFVLATDAFAATSARDRIIGDGITTPS